MDALGLKQLLIHKETIEKDVDASFLHVVLENEAGGLNGESLPAPSGRRAKRTGGDVRVDRC